MFKRTKRNKWGASTEVTREQLLNLGTKNLTIRLPSVIEGMPLVADIPATEALQFFDRNNLESVKACEHVFPDGYETLCFELPEGNYVEINRIPYANENAQKLSKVMPSPMQI